MNTDLWNNFVNVYGEYVNQNHYSVFWCTPISKSSSAPHLICMVWTCASSPVVTYSVSSHAQAQYVSLGACQPSPRAAAKRRAAKIWGKSAEKLKEIRKMRQLKNPTCPGLDVSLEQTEFCEVQLAHMLHIMRLKWKSAPPLKNKTANCRLSG